MELTLQIQQLLRPFIHTLKSEQMLILKIHPTQILIIFTKLRFKFQMEQEQHRKTFRSQLLMSLRVRHLVQQYRQTPLME